MNCVRCGAAAILPGNVGSELTTSFRPDGLRWFTLRSSLPLPSTFNACTRCGHLWTECSAGELRALVDASATRELVDSLCRRANMPKTGTLVRVAGLDLCPMCHDPVHVGGRIGGKEGHLFHPQGMRLISWTRTIELNYLPGEALLRACTSCGHVWGALHAGLLRNLIDSAGSDRLRDRMNRLGMGNP